MSYPRQNTIVDVDQKTAQAAVVTLPNPGTDRCWRVRKILASYGTSTQVGTVTITNLRGPSGQTRTIVRDLVGSTAIDLDEGGAMSMAGANAPVITLSAGAASVVGNLTVLAFPE